LFVFYLSTIYNRYERPYSVGIIPYMYRESDCSCILSDCEFIVYKLRYDVTNEIIENNADDYTAFYICCFKKGLWNMYTAGKWQTELHWNLTDGKMQDWKLTDRMRFIETFVVSKLY